MSHMNRKPTTCKKLLSQSVSLALLFLAISVCAQSNEESAAESTAAPAEQPMAEPSDTFTDGKQLWNDNRNFFCSRRLKRRDRKRRLLHALRSLVLRMF